MVLKIILICICILITPTNAGSKNIPSIQIIDINKDESIKNIILNSEIHHEVKNLLEGITGVYVKLNPYPTNGFVIKIPLEPNISVENQWFHDIIDEVHIYIS